MTALSGALLAACVGEIGNPSSEGGDGSEASGAGTLLTPAEENAELLALQARRLSHTELGNTLVDLFEIEDPETFINRLPFVEDEAPNGYDNNAKALQPSSLLLSQYDERMSNIARRNDGKIVNALTCDHKEDAQACSRQFIEDFGKRAFRRPLSEVDVTSFSELFWADGNTDFKVGIERVVHAMLLSPEFLYRVELGRQDDEAKLTPYETASRLSYFLWRSMPDEELFAAAERDELQTQEQVAAQVDRMIADPRAEEAFLDFFKQWMHLKKLPPLGKSPKLETDYVGHKVAREETRRFVRSILYQKEGTLADLLTSRRTFVNASLAKLYGVEGPGSDEEWQEVELGPERAAGFLTQVSYLAIHGHSRNPSPVLRGVFVLDRLLCQDLGLPPPDAQSNAAIPEDADPQTNREEYDLLTGGAECGFCHQIINPIGYGFEHFDTAGGYRKSENDVPIDATGQLPQGGSFRNAGELAQALLEHDDTAACVANHWLEYAQNGGADPGMVKSVASVLKDGTLKDAMRSIAMDPRFFSHKFTQK